MFPFNNYEMLLSIAIINCLFLPTDARRVVQRGRLSLENDDLTVTEVKTEDKQRSWKQKTTGFLIIIT